MSKVFSWVDYWYNKYLDSKAYERKLARRYRRGPGKKRLGKAEREAIAAYLEKSRGV